MTFPEVAADVPSEANLAVQRGAQAGARRVGQESHQKQRQRGELAIRFALALGHIYSYTLRRRPLSQPRLGPGGTSNFRINPFPFRCGQIHSQTYQDRG